MPIALKNPLRIPIAHQNLNVFLDEEDFIKRNHRLERIPLEENVVGIAVHDAVERMEILRNPIGLAFVPEHVSIERQIGARNTALDNLDLEVAHKLVETGGGMELVPDYEHDPAFRASRNKGGEGHAKAVLVLAGVEEDRIAVGAGDRPGLIEDAGRRERPKRDEFELVVFGKSIGHPGNEDEIEGIDSEHNQETARSELHPSATFSVQI
jgi:hypothetical protein